MLPKRYLLLGFGLSGCVDQISADLPAPPKVLVVNSILTPDSVVRVQVSRVASAVDTSARALAAAEVRLLAPGQPAEVLRNQGRGLYASVRRPADGGVYTVRVQAPGYPTAQATDTLPVRVPIREAWYSFPTGTDRNNEPLGTLVVRFDDPAATRNYYELVAYQEQATPSRVIRSQDYELDVRGNAALAAEGDAEFMPATLVFSDQLFNGQAFELRATFKAQGYGSGGTVNGQPVPPRVLGSVRVVLRTVSRAYYQYRKSWTRHLYNQGTHGPNGNLAQLLFLGDPTRMYSNVEPGYGVVVGHAQEDRVVPLR
ncbi:DUF4249 domain-containing protein [Hymenobacter jeollabukensis]|uniref:DUF4249 domain-containing protein n=1 Tax=Hymenobacter jeollabukensis TaxID=2025313 RepID=A0A5R8WNL9_9BACT|nr:DUF4249 domain-containing protein [Hymenobacter jeollabukensis]TLM91629.1 DUF4249 domain-containing protein [Hymenobacter jeollabukensis]